MDDTLARAPSPALFVATSNRGSSSSGQRSRSASPSIIGTAPATPQQQPSTNAYANATPRRGRRGRRKVLGLKTAHANQRGNDPFDYEQKYGEDEEFKEMGPMARIWKVFLDECGAFDSEMVEDWRDALDVLLVFAGLFSAVVTTFVSQLCQRLEADFTEINAHLMFESINIDRAKAAGMSVLEVPRSPLTPFTPFRPSKTAIWVNGLWFTSLALSLTTALMAVLMKQWIHQYMSVPSGTPRDRSRIRQFRYMSLQQWQVPVIIGLLPVLMHISLGVFFAGLIVFLYSLNTTMSGVITTIASLAFIIYFATNLLPLYKTGCPYKTPLTIHSYAFVISVWDSMKTFTKAGGSLPSREHISLKAVEQETVAREADSIDAQSITWLHNVSSNSSVQRIVLQAFSSLPLGTVETVRTVIPQVDQSIRRCLYEYGTPERRYGYERLTRALIRFNKHPKSSPNPFQEDPVENSLLRLIYPIESASGDTARFLAQQILKPTVQLDVISWLWVFRNAVLVCIDWLEIGSHDSVVWSSFLSVFLQSHHCNASSHRRKEAGSITLDCLEDPLPPFQAYKGFKLVVYESNGRHREPKSTSDSIDFRRAISDFMYPSLCEFLLSAIFPPFVVIADETLPSDVRLHLALIQLRSIQTAEIPVIEGRRPLRRIIDFIKAYVDIDTGDIRIVNFGGPIIHHHQLPGAVFSSIHAIITKSDAFEIHVCHKDQSDLVHALFRCLVLDKKLRQNHKHWPSTTTLTKKILGVAFHRAGVFSLPLITEILNYFYLSKSAIGIEMYRGLLDGMWYDYLRHEFLLLDDDDEHVLSLDERGWGAADHAHSFMVVGYIDGLEILEELEPVLYGKTLADIRAPSNLLILCQVLILGDAESRNRLWKLAKLIDRDQWKTCLASLSDFLRTDAAEQFYKRQISFYDGHHPYHQHVALTFDPFDELGGFVDQFSLAWQWYRGNFPLTTPIYNAPKQLEDLHPFPRQI